MYVGDPRRDLRIAADAVRETGLESPSILEVGCGSGYYTEVFNHLLDAPVTYVGTDYSLEMIRKARHTYADRLFFAADAAALPVRDDTVDVVFNGAALMHLYKYETAIVESARVSAKWCFFHSVPILDDGETTYLRKDAYGEPTIEIVFAEAELLDLFESTGLDVRRTYRSVDYQPKKVHETVENRSYLCRVG
jgi:ubiquinone/menaquinone biosynthesis C-methylase UbiE